MRDNNYLGWKLIIGGFLFMLLSLLFFNIDLPNKDFLIFDIIRVEKLLAFLSVVGVIVGVVAIVKGLMRINNWARR